jgi:hypothetical protein
MEILGVQISKKLAEWIDKRVNTVQEPNTYIIKGYGAFNLTAQQIAENTFTEILNWVMRNDGDIELIENTYPAVAKPLDGMMKVKIYSPNCEKVIEEIIQRRVDKENQLMKERRAMRQLEYLRRDRD